MKIFFYYFQRITQQSQKWSKKIRIMRKYVAFLQPETH